jgi:hypothetical protein
MVVGEADQIEAGTAGGSGPITCFRIPPIPSPAVAEVATTAQLADIVDQGAGIAECKAAPIVEVGKRIPGAGLVGIAAVIFSENVFEIVLRVP